MAGIGTGSTLDISSWPATVDIISIEVSGVSRESVESSTLGTSGGKTFIAGDLYDPGTVEIEYLLDPDTLNADQPPISTAAATLTITLARDVATSDSTFTATGFMTEWGMSIPLEDRMTATGTFKLTGTAGWLDPA